MDFVHVSEIPFLNQEVKEFIVVGLSLIKSSPYAKNGQSPAYMPAF